MQILPALFLLTKYIPEHLSYILYNPEIKCNRASTYNHDVLIVLLFTEYLDPYLHNRNFSRKIILGFRSVLKLTSSHPRNPKYKLVTPKNCSEHDTIITGYQERSTCLCSYVHLLMFGCGGWGVYITASGV
jgi:hypothetical protein